MAFGGDDAQPALGLDLLVQALPLVVQLVRARVLVFVGQRVIGLDQLHLLLDVAPEHDVGSAAGHVGRDRDDAGAPRLRDDLGLFGMLLRVEHLVRQLLLRQQTRDQFRVLD